MPNKNPDIRWKQRFTNYEKAVQLLADAAQLESPSEVERAGLIQFYEMAFELAWKLLKDYLEEEGFMVNSPRQTIKQAFQAGLLDEGQVWMEALTDRNLTSRTYNETIAEQVADQIRARYYPALCQLHETMKAKLTP